jgi:hypothetical protein
MQRGGAMGATLFDKIWSQHRVFEDEGGKTLLYIDRVVVDDVRAPQVLKNFDERSQFAELIWQWWCKTIRSHLFRPIQALGAVFSLMQRARPPVIMVFGFSMSAMPSRAFPM